MKSEKEEIDRLIEQALTEEEATFYHKLDEQNLLEMVGGLFQGKMKWLSVMVMIIQVIMFALAVYFAIQFFTATELEQMIRLGVAAMVFLLSTTVLKMFQWMQMDKNAIIREIKRMELQVSILASRLKNGTQE